MKYKPGVIIGFVTGMANFLLLFKIIVLPRIAPSDELAPGIVMMAAVLAGVLFAFIGWKVQQRIVRNKKAI